MTRGRPAGAVILAALSAACGTPPVAGQAEMRVELTPDRAKAQAEVSVDAPVRDLLSSPDADPAGEILALTYNVAGLPFGLSKSDPDRNTPLISPLLNPFGLVLLQEDFSYTPQLSSAATHPYKSTPGQPAVGALLNDGLTMFSRVRFTGFVRHRWTHCFGVVDNGSDCLASKGFSVAELELAPGVVAHVYNLHMDAGQDAPDFAARAAQVEQLLQELSARSAKAAVIVGGDTNLKLSASVDNQALLDKLLAQGGLTDACQALGCGDPRIDRIFYRGGPALTLAALSWTVDGSFVDAAGKPLSDHEAVAVRLGWKARRP